MNIPSVISSKEYKANFVQGASPFTGDMPLYVSNDNLKYPKSLLKDGWKWFLEFCEDYKIDASKYICVEISRNDGVTWQIDFYQNKECSGSNISLYEIYFGDRKILQAKWNIG